MIVYRKMRAEDVPFISRLEEETFSMPWSVDSFLQMIEKEDTAYFVAEEDGQLLGGCGLLLIAGEGSITNVVVSPVARRRGVATGLLTYLRALARSCSRTFFSSMTRRKIHVCTMVISSDRK